MSGEVQLGAAFGLAFGLRAVFAVKAVALDARARRGSPFRLGVEIASDGRRAPVSTRFDVSRLDGRNRFERRTARRLARLSLAPGTTASGGAIGGRAGARTDPSATRLDARKRVELEFLRPE